MTETLANHLSENRDGEFRGKWPLPDGARPAPDPEKSPQERPEEPPDPSFPASDPPSSTPLETAPGKAP
jgi:hypothetical protein